jgi:uncharacterized flavoprotein (TIGR03862 family)
LKKSITIIGGGACALMLGAELDPKKFNVFIYEKNAALGRKFLVAGEGGLNLTHSEKEDVFISKYHPKEFLEKSFFHFSNQHFIKWINNILGIETYVGSSGRIFPKKGIKPIQVLNAFLHKLKSNKVNIHTKRKWKGFSENQALLFEYDKQTIEVKSDYVIFCLGGASWPVTGSVGEWTDYFRDKKIDVKQFHASNCAFIINWDKNLIPKIEGKALKNITVTCGKITQTGEVVLTRTGIEGSGIYPLSFEIRQALNKQKQAAITIDLKPVFSEEKIIEKLSAKSKQKNLSDHLKTNIGLSEPGLALLKHFLSKEEFLDNKILAKKIKFFNLTITATGPIEDAISTTGGIALNEVGTDFQLKKLPNYFVMGEMLDYDAPTGGYLLQSCFSMAKYLADQLNK